MKERFKSYLEAQFRQIAPTKAAMEYRIDTLNKMLDRAQELRIKGITDDELIYNTVIAELGDFASTLRGYENQIIKKEVSRRVGTFGIAIGIGYIIGLVLCYLIVGFVAHIWHPTWLIIVGGVLIGVIALMITFATRCAKHKSYLPLRSLIVGTEVIASVVVFLFLQLVGKVTGSYLTFLAMVALVAVVDTVIAFVTNSRFKWIELPICVEAVCVMLYVILGISLSYGGVSIWHPAWLMCLGGVLCALVEIIVVLGKRANDKKKEEIAENTVVDESYWSKWE